MSGRLTRQRLQVAGVAAEDVEQAMAALDDELGTDPAKRELQAALAFARRRRLGPFRAKDREAYKARDLARWLVRASPTASPAGSSKPPTPMRWTKAERLAMVRPTRKA